MSSTVSKPASKFRTVLGFGQVQRTSHDSLDLPANPATTATTKRQQLSTAIFAAGPNPPRRSEELATSPLATAHTSMPSTTQRHRPPVAASQDGPWSVSAAEVPNDPHTYSIYIKTPTHNITLTRTAAEIVDLHDKLRGEIQPSALPKLPIDSAAVQQATPQKRRSSFLHTLSKFTSSSSGSSRNSSFKSPSIAQTPLASPGAEESDPFDTSLSAPSGQSSTTTGLAAYLTTLSNDPTARVSRHWRKFVRVRTDDLESVRVERAIKRVRSDLGAHHGPGTQKDDHPPLPSVSNVAVAAAAAAASSAASTAALAQQPQADKTSRPTSTVGDIAEEDDIDAATHAEIPASSASEDDVHSTATSGDNAGATRNGVVTSPPSPVNDHPSLRIPRSASADPDKAHRLSRVWTAASSPLKSGDVTETDTEAETDQTDQDQSAGEAIVRKKDRKRKTPREPRKSKKVVIDDFEMIRVLGKGCAGKVLLVRHKAESNVYALKAITKRHVLAHQELQHTLTEQAVLKRMAGDSKDPFVVKLHWSFHDKENLFLVMDFHPGGDLATQLARWGRLGRDRARFYAAEIVEGVEGLHAMGVIYRDLKPENILIGGDGHIVLTDFGLSKEFPRRNSTNGNAALPTAPSTPTGKSNGTDYYSSGSSPKTSDPTVPSWMTGAPHATKDQTTTFCGTAEYLAPEVIQGLPYSYEVDWWSFGTMLYEMLTGITPFWANNHSDMYVRVLQDELTFPDDRSMDQDTKSLIRGLLQRNPALRMSEPRVKRHPYFSMIDWSHVYFKRYIPPYIPPTDPSNELDTQNFDDTFLDMEPTVINEDNQVPDDPEENKESDAQKTDGEEGEVKTPPAQKTSLAKIDPDDEADVFDGYSYKARNSVILDDDVDVFEDHDGDSDEDPLKADREDAVSTATPSIMDEAGADTETEADLGELDGDGVKTPQRAPTPQRLASPPPPLEVVEPVKPVEVVEVIEPVEIIEDLTPPEVSTPTPSDSKDKQLGAKPASPAPAKVDQNKLAPPVQKGRPISQASSELDQELRDLVNDTVRLDDTLAEEEVPKAGKTPTGKAVAAPSTKSTAASRAQRKGRTERSGVAALDRGLGAIQDEEYATEHEDDDWDFIEKPGGEDINGQRGTSLFARGVVDRYRLAVFTRKQSPHPTNRAILKGTPVPDSDVVVLDSPSRRGGKSTGLSLKTRTFLRPKSPPSTFSSGTSRSFTANSTSSFGALSPSPSLPIGQSLRSKPSTTSVAHSSSSDQSNNGEGSRSTEPPTSPKMEAVDATLETPDKPKAKKLKKAADQVFALFGSPRP